jgi:hypothetical protein
VSADESELGRVESTNPEKRTSDGERIATPDAEEPKAGGAARPARGVPDEISRGAFAERVSWARGGH